MANFWDYINNVDTGMQWNKDLLAQAQQVLQGKLKPQDTPQFQMMQQMMMLMQKQMMQDKLKELTRAGISGGAAASSLAGDEENLRKSWLEIIGKMPGQMINQGNVASGNITNTSNQMAGLYANMANAWRNRQKGPNLFNQITQGTKDWTNIAKTIAGGSGGFGGPESTSTTTPQATGTTDNLGFQELLKNFNPAMLAGL
jgi:hypothetical protein